MKVTPILFAAVIEPTRDFFCQRLGFQETVSVPEGDRLGFVILNQGAVEVMLQTRSGVAADMPAVEKMVGGSFLFCEVPDFETARRAVEGCEIVVPVRDTFYGMREIAVREPGGNVICLAAKIAAE